ncbi:hypothetical protein [Planctobacterium marinum]|uniref:hypothetical protein n=1 Tax=Planctobacterium marinum TaxID=1631968 RepID=UPI001E629BC0|nr:hypothetical protein [Planctobacterium marinum]MCC2604419.1 hypothetical protein [Planctobacterium marinum]
MKKQGMTIETSWVAPLEEVFAELNDEAKKSARDQSKEAYKLMLKWGVTTTVFLILIGTFVYWNPFERDIHTWFARSGSLIVLIPLLSEIWFLSAFNKLIPEDSSSAYPRLLICVYLERKFKKLRCFSVIVTTTLIISGTLIWGYGDLIQLL